MSQRLNQESSTVLVRNLLRLSVSTIAYHRGFFPQSCFTKRRAPNGCTFYQLIGNSLESNRLVDWLEEGVFAALDKRYLKTMIILLFRPENAQDSPRQLLERYEFSVTYDCSETNDSQASKNYAIHSIECTLGKLIDATTALPALPELFAIDMYLTYAPHAPQQYHPTFFQQGMVECQRYMESKKHPTSCEFGDVSTGYNTISICMHAD